MLSRLSAENEVLWNAITLPGSFNFLKEVREDLFNACLSKKKKL